MKAEDEASKAIERRIVATEKTLTDEYYNALKTIKGRLGTLYEKYSKDGVLTYAEMSKYNRLSSIYKFLDGELKSLGKTTESEVKWLAVDAYEQAFYRYGYAIESGANIDLNWGLVDREKIKSLIEEPNVSGKSLVDTLGQQRYDLLVRQRQSIVQGFVLGESYPNVAERLVDSFGVSLTKALTIARTEGTRAATEGQVAAYEYAEDLGVEFDIIWLATLDDRTRDAHADLDGQKADEDGMFHYEGMEAEGPGMWGDAAMDINCRCRLISEIKDFPAKYRRAGEDVIENKTYREWEKEVKGE